MHREFDAVAGVHLRELRLYDDSLQMMLERTERIGEKTQRSLLLEIPSTLRRLDHVPSKRADAASRT